MIVYKIILILLKVILFSLQTLGLWYLIHFIPQWKRAKNGGLVGSYEFDFNKDFREKLDRHLAKDNSKMTPIIESGGLVGKTVRLKGGDEGIVLGVFLEHIDPRQPQKGRTTLVIYRGKKGRGKLETVVLYRKDDKELYSKYNKTGPVKSREIRKDVRLFCNNSCIQDCTECILKKYGKGHKAE